MTATSKVPWLDYLSNHIGLEEIPGPEHNPLIVEWGQASGISWWNNDEDAWCAVAVNGALVNAGFPSTRSALARSFTRYGIKLTRPVRGAIVVFPRGSNPLYGHVGIVELVRSDGTIVIVNGNSGNRVRRSVFRISSILPDGIRWPPGADAPEEAEPLGAGEELGERDLRFGMHGADVAALQRDLNVLNYGLTVDGMFGGRTRDAVKRFEDRRNLVADGVADAATLAALASAVAERRETAKTTSTAAKGAAGGGVTVAAAAGAATAVSGAAKDVGGLWDGTALGLVFFAMVLAAAGVAAFFLWRHFGRGAAA